ncbi:MAG: glycine cleavage system protein T [Eubacteriales bacterium]|nr:glycine cleavage system protein T [Eubacteriales bacterium]
MAEQTPLYREHLQLSGKMVEFAGFLLPVQYPGGISAEHLAVRQEAGLFDVSHMGEIEVSGEQTYAFLDYLLSRNLDKIDQAIASRRALYAVMCTADGTAVDDLLIYPLSPTRCLLIVNAANIAADEAHIRAVADEWARVDILPADLAIENHSDRWAQLALQGPQSLQVLTKIASGLAGLGAPSTLTARFAADRLAWVAQLSALKKYQFTYLPLPLLLGETYDGPLHLISDDFEAGGTTVLVSRTGYTGEDGFEFYLQPEDAPLLWRMLVAAGAKPAGLGARDTLRLEAGMPLYGHELSRTITPREAGLDRFLALNKASFVGQTGLLAEPTRQLVGLVSLGKAIPRAGYLVLSGDQVVGSVTSGTFSPSLNKGIALALVERSAVTADDLGLPSAGYLAALPSDVDHTAGLHTLAIEIRGRAEPFALCQIPFI